MSIRMNRLAVILLITGLVPTNDSFADTPGRTMSAVKSSVTQSDASESRMLKQQAGYWSLDVTEYQRYLTLMDGPLGKWNPTMDPLMALGMFAESDYETQRYAELYAQQEYELTEKILRFQQAYYAAFNRLYPNARLFDQKLLEPYYMHKNRKSQLRSAKRTIQRQFKEGDRLLIFVPRACQGCGTQVHTLTTLLAGIPDARVDVYVRGVKNDQGVHDWAKVQAINPQWLGRSANSES